MRTHRLIDRATRLDHSPVPPVPYVPAPVAPPFAQPHAPHPIPENACTYPHLPAARQDKVTEVFGPLPAPTQWVLSDR